MEGISAQINQITNIKVEDLLLDETFEFNEIGANSNYAALFSIGEKSVSGQFESGQENARFGFFDGNPQSNSLNSTFVTYLEVLSQIQNKESSFLLLKDFIAKRSPYINKPQASILVQVKIPELIFKDEESFVGVEETSFNLKELMDEKE